MPTRVITGGVGVIPGATMAERRLHFLEHLRPPPHAAHVRAARPRGDERRDPAAADPARRRLRRAVHRGVRLPADVRARHHRRRHRAGRDRHGRGRRAGHHHPARHPGRAGRRRRRGRGRRGHGRSRSRNVPSFCVGLDRKVERARIGRRSPTTWPTAATSTRSCRSTSSACRSTARARTTSSTPAWRSWTRSTPRTSPSTPRTRTSRGCHHVYLAAPGLRRPALAARHGHPPRLVRPLARAAPAPARGWPSCTPAASSPLDTDFVNESFIGTRFIGRLVEETDGRRAPGRRAHHHRPGLGHRHRPVLARPDRPVPGGLPALKPARPASPRPASPHAPPVPRSPRMSAQRASAPALPRWAASGPATASRSRTRCGPR